MMKTSVLPRKNTVALLFCAILLLAFTSACSVVQPPKLENEDMINLANLDTRAMYAEQEPIAGPISIEEAVARAIKYNLQHRLALMERALADDLTDVKYFSMLPKITADAGYRHRNNEDASSSESIKTGNQSLEPSKSRERTSKTAELEMTWNILDFGLSYFEAKAQGNKALAAEERRRRVVGDIIRQTRAAFWSAVSAEKMRNEVAVALSQAQNALAQSREAQARRLNTPIVALRYQRDLVNMLRQIEQLDNELAKAKAQLASLMNLAPGTEYSLALPAEGLRVPIVGFGLNDLEALAMVRRPELREESYLARNAVLETRMAMLRLFPNLSLFGGVNYDSNKYLEHANWATAGARVSWNLLNLFSIPSIIKSGESREEVALLRRQALRMTVLSQVHVAWHQRQYAEKAFERAEELYTLQAAIREHTENAVASRAETQLELVRTKVETLLSKRARDLIYAEMLNAQDAIYQAAGLDIMPDEVSSQSVAGLAAAIAEQSRLNENGHAEVPALAPVASIQAANASPYTQPVFKSDGMVVSRVSANSTSQRGGVTYHPAVRLVRGTPWESLESLQGQP